MDKVDFCCDVFPKMTKFFAWFSYPDDDGIKKYCMPSIFDTEAFDGQPHYWRVNHCPSCGKLVRSIVITEEQYKEIMK